MSTPNADHVLDLHEGGGTSTPHGEFRPPVVVGGRYVVGENPTWNNTFDGAQATVDYLTAGSRVVVEEFRKDSNVWVNVEGKKQWCLVDPRHLTPAPEQLPEVVEEFCRQDWRGQHGEHLWKWSGHTHHCSGTPAPGPVSDGFRQTDTAPKSAPPAVDDGLLWHISVGAQLANDASKSRFDNARAFLASEPMVRLFSVWTAVVAAQRDQYADQWEEAVLERDEARAEATRLRTREGDLEVWLQRIAEAFDMGTDDLTDEEVVSNLEELRSNRDDLALRVDRQNEELDVLRRTNPSTTLSAAAVEVVRALNDAGISGDDTAGAGWPWIGEAVRRLLAGPVTREVQAEVERSTRKHGDQSHLPNGTGPDLILRDLPNRADRLADWARARCKAASHNEGGDGTIAWEHILTEEFYEALAEDDPRALRAELVQVAAVAVKWVEAIDAEAVDDTHDDEVDVVDELLADACDEEMARNGASSALDRLCKLREDVRRARNGQEAGRG